MTISLAGSVGIGRAERAGVARDARIDLAVGRAHREVVDRALRHAVLHGHLGRGGVRRADDEVSVGVRRRHGAVGQLFRRDISGCVRIAGWRHWPRRCLRCRSRRSPCGGWCRGCAPGSAPTTCAPLATTINNMPIPNGPVFICLPDPAHHVSVALCRDSPYGKSIRCVRISCADARLRPRTRSRAEADTLHVGPLFFRLKAEATEPGGHCCTLHVARGTWHVGPLFFRLKAEATRARPDTVAVARCTLHVARCTLHVGTRAPVLPPEGGSTRARRTPWRAGL